MVDEFDTPCAPQALAHITAGPRPPQATRLAPVPPHTASPFSGPIKNWFAGQPQSQAVPLEAAPTGATAEPTAPCNFGPRLGRQCTRESGPALASVPLPALALATEWATGYTEKMRRVVVEQVAVEDTLCAERCPTPAGWPYPCGCRVCVRAHRYIKITKHAIDTHTSDARKRMKKVAGITKDELKMLINPAKHKTTYSPAIRACHWYKGHQAKGRQKKATFNEKP